MNKRIEEDPFGPFNFSHFKKWMGTQKEEKPKEIGIQIESKIPTKKLYSRIEVQKGILEEVVKDFKKNGGIINDVDGQSFLVEVKSGTFLIHKMYTKKLDD